MHALPRIGCRYLVSALSVITRALFHLRRDHLVPLARNVKDWWFLPPGLADPFDRNMRFNQRYTLERAARLGPIFKVWWNGGHTTCILGHARARRLLLAKEDALRGATIDLRPLFSIGHLRAMQGETHRKYRRKFVEALNAMSVETHEPALREWIRTGLEAMLGGRHSGTVEREDLRLRLRTMTMGIMLRVLLGVTPQSREYAELTQQYRNFGPEAPVWTIRHSQRAAFAEISRVVAHLAGDTCNHSQRGGCPSALAHLVAQNELDETAAGNLIYMVESSHFDLYSLWTWILQHLAANPDWATRFRAEIDAPRLRTLAEAIVFETLRLEQSEAVNRVATSNIVFDGYRIPPNTVVRACLWEGHKDPRVFTDPFAFEPNRFVDRSWSIEEFAPFGLDKHRCIAAEFVVSVSALFIEVLLSEYRVALAAVGPPRLGAFHWEPGPDLAIVLSRISGGVRP